MAKDLGITPYLGEIRMFGGNFPPQNWLLCDGKVLKINDYPDLFTLIGNRYGGDGINTFAVPDLQGRVPIHIGPGNELGTKGGEEFVTLHQDELPKHTHTVHSDMAGGNSSAAEHYWGYSDSKPYAVAPGNLAMNPGCVTVYGKSGAHENRIPFQAVNFIIAFTGDYPSGE